MFKPQLELEFQPEPVFLPPYQKSGLGDGPEIIKSAKERGAKDNECLRVFALERQADASRDKEEWQGREC